MDSHDYFFYQSVWENPSDYKRLTRLKKRDKSTVLDVVNELHSLKWV